MFFFFFQNDFANELRDFIVNPKLKQECEKAAKQLLGFADRFPLVRLGELAPEDCISNKDMRADDLYNWITRKTGYVVRNKAATLYKLGTIGEHPDVYGIQHYGKRYPVKRPSQEKFHNAVKTILYPFLISRGQESVELAEREFGKLLLFKLLYLYYPSEYVAIDSVGVIDAAIDKFLLDYYKSAYERNHALNTFIGINQKQYRVAERLEGPAIRTFLVDYLCLTTESKPFARYLKEEEGLSDEIVEKYRRSLQFLSRLLEGYGIIGSSIFRTNDLKSSDGLRFLIEQLSRNVMLPEVRRTEYAKVLDVYASYLAKKSSSVVSYVQRIVGPISPDLGESEFNQQNEREWVSTKHQENSKRKDTGWNNKFKSARTPNDVVRLLEDAAEARKYFRHYTTLSAFLCITEGEDDWMFRLTRGDSPNMNDQLEWRRLGDADTWRRTFICSFSGVEDESAAMWGLYGKPNNEALRLSFSRDAMMAWINMLRRKSCNGLVAQFFGSNDKVGPKIQLSLDDVEIHFADVLYGGSICDGEEPSDTYTFRKHVLNKNLFSHFDSKFEKTPEITGFIKSQDWAYEEESRIIIRVKDGVVLPGGKSLDDIQYVFIPVPKTVMAAVEYKRGPCVPEKLRAVLGDKIIQVIGPNAIISDSKYKDNLKFK